jgi:hypothetical protein
MEKDVADHIKNRGDQIYLQAMLGEAWWTRFMNG